MGKDMDPDVSFKEIEGGRGKGRGREGGMTGGREEERRQIMGWLSTD